jgi:putative hydrolase of the HAD superfamily
MDQTKLRGGGDGTAVEAVIFDYSGVIHREDPADWDEVARRYGLPAGAAWSAFHDIPEYALSRAGRLSGPEFRAAVVHALARSIGEADAERVVAGIEAQQRAQVPVEPEMDALLDRLRGRVRLGCLTNGGKGSRERLAQWGVLERFDDVVCSGDVGLAKPDPAVYRLAASRLGVAAPDCAYVDDLERNVAGAREAGMRVHRHHWARMADLLRFLAEVGALPR